MLRRVVSVLALLGALAGCAHGIDTPPGTPSPSDVNPITGSRGGTANGH